jgi:hypothetical protein
MSGPYTKINHSLFLVRSFRSLSLNFSYKTVSTVDTFLQHLQKQRDIYLLSIETARRVPC